MSKNDSGVVVKSLNGFARCADGARIAYWQKDRGPGSPRVVLVHSLAMDHRFWGPVGDRLSEVASVVTYDCRGHGSSDKSPGPYTVELFAQDLAGLLDQIGWKDALVAGASMGGCVSLAFAAKYPQRVTALGLINTTAWYGAKAREDWAERAQKAAASGLSALIKFQISRWFTDKFCAQHLDVVKECIDVFLANQIEAYVATCHMLGAADLRAALPRFTMPAAVIVGDEDYAAPVAMAQAMHDGIAGSTLTVLDGARHLTPLEQPERVAAELIRLLSSMGQSDKPHMRA